MLVQPGEAFLFSLFRSYSVLPQVGTSGAVQDTAQCCPSQLCTTAPRETPHPNPALYLTQLISKRALIQPALPCGLWRKVTPCPAGSTLHQPQCWEIAPLQGSVCLQPQLPSGSPLHPQKPTKTTSPSLQVGDLVTN